MKSLGKKPEGARLERLQDSPLWSGEAFRNIHPIQPKNCNYPGAASAGGGVGRPIWPTMRWQM